MMNRRSQTDLKDRPIDKVSSFSLLNLFHVHLGNVAVGCFDWFLFLHLQFMGFPSFGETKDISKMVIKDLELSIDGC